MKITAIRGAGLVRGPDVFEDLVSVPALMVKRAIQEIEDTQDIRRVTVRAVYRDGMRLGQLVRVYNELGIPVHGKLTGIQHEQGGQVSMSVLTLEVPAQRPE